MKTIEHIEKEAGAKLSRENVAKRSGGGGKDLSYVEAHYVIQRMNEIFGPMGWDSETVEMREVTLEGAKPAYVAKVRVSAIVKTEEGYMKSVKEGFGFGSDKSGLNPHEMAVKEAESDAFKRAARQFGMSLGLALYDKTQENVEDAPKATPVGHGDIHDVPFTGKYPTAPKPNRAALNRKLSAIATVLVKKGIKTPDALKEQVKALFGVDNKEALTDTQAKELYTTWEKEANG